MATSSSTEDEGKKIGDVFAVNPKRDCPHVQPLVAGIEYVGIDISLPCGVCQNKGENWLCLKCSEVYCSRYVKEHMVHHNTQNPSHEIAISFSDLSFWCYACDDYIDSPQLMPLLNAATIAKFDALPQMLNSKAIAEPQTSRESSGKDTEAGEEAPSESQKSEESSARSTPFHLESSLEKEVLLSRIRATIYGNCIGDAIGLLTEFMTKEEAREIYGTVREKRLLGLKKSRNYVPFEKLKLEYSMKDEDFHRSRWLVGDWTDDSDQMILILRTLLDHNGKADILDFVQKFKVWTQTGYKELGDFGGMGIGQTTFNVILQKEFLTDPHKCAYQVWDDSGRWVAPNGGVMRTSILGIQDFSDIPTVIHNTQDICKVTHADPRCIASCVAVTTAIALMLQGKHRKGDEYDEQAICEEAFKYACEELETEEQREELRRHMFAEKLSELELSSRNKIGYTYKCLGAGFWAYRQKDFRLALTEVVMEAGDADTNGAVAGALLGCKLGVEYLPETWLNGLRHKDWLDPQIDRLCMFDILGLSLFGGGSYRIQKSRALEPLSTIVLGPKRLKM